MKTISKYLIMTTMMLPITLLQAQKGPFELPKLPYAYDALEPAIDAKTMEIHHDRHHAAYVKNLNAALAGQKFAEDPLEELMLYASEYGDALRNNAGGHYNHSLFWNTLALNKPFDPASEVGKAVLKTFGSLDSLNTLLSKAGASRFGSGWAWLYINTDHQLAVCSTPNQDNPIMDVAEHRGLPILAIDVWEHAYYLKYQNKRADYLNAILGAINWEAVNKNYTEGLASPLLKSIEKETWTELNAFHRVMAQTYHPSEDGDLKPIRERSGEMAEKAVALQNGNIPLSFRTPEIRKAIQDLVNGSKELDGMVKKNATDQELAKKLDGLHDVFHTIQGLCRH